MKKEKLIESIIMLLAYNKSPESPDLIGLKKALGKMAYINIYRLWDNLRALNEFRLKYKD